jgi:hypothetical protein
MITFTELLKKADAEKIAIHTPTKKQAKTLLTELDKGGYMWLSGKELTATTRYEDYEENTCYDFYNDAGRLLDKKVMFSPLSFYQNKSYTIIEFSDIDFKEEI